MFLFNMSFVFVDAKFVKLNGGVGMNQSYGQYDPRTQITIDLGNMVDYMNDPGGAHYIILHELFHSTFLGRTYNVGVKAAYSPAWNFREQTANNFAKSIAGYISLPVTHNFSPTNPSYSE